MAQCVAGDQYYVLDGQLHEIKRQLRQLSGYPFDPERLKMALQNIIEGKFMASPLESAPGQIFSLSVEGKHTVSKLIVLGRYDWANDGIIDERFPIVVHEPMNRTIEYVTFDHDLDSEEVLVEFARHGLKCPTYEDAFYFGIQYPEEQRKHPIVWLHEPVQDPQGVRYVLVLYKNGRRRELYLFWFDRGWYRGCVFPAVRM